MYALILFLNTHRYTDTDPSKKFLLSPQCVWSLPFFSLFPHNFFHFFFSWHTRYQKYQHVNNKNTTKHYYAGKVYGDSAPECLGFDRDRSTNKATETASWIFQYLCEDVVLDADAVWATSLWRKQVHFHKTRTLHRSHFLRFHATVLTCHISFNFLGNSPLPNACYPFCSAL